MKYVGTEKKEFLVRRQGRIESRRRSIRNSNRIRNLRYVVRDGEAYEIIHLPSYICIGNEFDRNRIVGCITQMRRAVAIDNRNVLLDFSSTRYAIADGMLLLYAEISRLKSRFGNRIKFRCRLPEGAIKKKGRPVNIEAEKVAQVLKHIGILEMLSNKAAIIPNREDVIHWRVAQGLRSEGQKTEPMLKIVDDLLGKSVSRKFYTGLTEAMTNSHHHAYEDIRQDGLNLDNESGWWMFLQAKVDSLSILICDLGIGIPRSLPKTNKYWLIDQLKQLSGHRDSAAIEYATQKGSTSTDMKNRGKGLKKMVGLVGEIPRASLAIYSNKGAYFVEEDERRFIGVMKRDFGTSILGTLVFWTVKLGEEARSEEN